MVTFFSWQWQMDIGLTVLSEAFMKRIRNIWLCLKKMHFLIKPTQLTKQKTVFPHLPPTSSSGQILLRLFSSGWQRACISVWILERDKISETVLTSTTAAFNLHSEIGFDAVLQSLGWCEQGIKFGKAVTLWD